MSAGLDPLEAPPADVPGPANAPGPADELLPPPTRRGPSGVALWGRVGLAVALLAASAAGRAWQARRVDHMLRDGRVCPFRLADLPMTLGPWTGHDEPMDPIIARTTGSTDNIQRVYQHGTTGQRLTVLVLFGPSSEMYIHSPEVCYGQSGYEQVYGPVPRTVREAPDAEVSWPFYETVYAKGERGQADQQDVYCSWRYSGAWTTGLTNKKQFERIPGMFKVQIARRARDSELGMLNVGNPCEAFLAHLMPEIDARIAAAGDRTP